MKLALAILSLATAVFAQNVVIAEPAPNATFAPGSDIVVSVARPGSITFSFDVSVAIGLHSCGGSCSGLPDDGLFDVLLKGDYSPQVIPGSHSTTEFQNYTVQVPEGTAGGPALLTVAHFFLGGADLSAMTDTVQEVIFIDTD